MVATPKNILMARSNARRRAKGLIRIAFWVPVSLKETLRAKIVALILKETSHDER